MFIFETHRVSPAAGASHSLRGERATGSGIYRKLKLSEAFFTSCQHTAINCSLSSPVLGTENFTINFLNSLEARDLYRKGTSYRNQFFGPKIDLYNWLFNKADVSF